MLEPSYPVACHRKPCCRVWRKRFVKVSPPVFFQVLCLYSYRISMDSKFIYDNKHSHYGNIEKPGFAFWC